MYKLVAIDVDGTMLDSQKRISQENKEAIKNAINAGTHVVVCSGRIYAGAAVIGKEIGTKLPIITCNGARIKDMKTNDVLFNRSVPLHICEKVIDYCHEHNIYYHIYVGDIFFTERLAYTSLSFAKKNKELPEEDRMDIRIVEDMKKALREYSDDISKIVIIDEDPDILAKTRSDLEKIKEIVLMSSGADNFEMMDAQVSKGAAVKFLAEKYGILQEEVMAIGDNENDLSMLEYAGLAVAMGNGEDYVKEIADFVTLSNDESGVAYAINKFVLNK